jgi:microcystin-dependent protein
MANLPSNKYFLYPFATVGDVSTGIPNTGTDSIAVNYQYGWTTPYQNPSPGGYPVPRNQMNQLFLDITTAIQTLQTQGFPDYVASADHGPTQYPAGAWVNYNGVIYVAQVATGSVPGVDATWQQQGVPAGMISDFGGFDVPAGYLPCDGLATYLSLPLLRADYPRLMAAITMPQTCTTNLTTTLTVADNSQMFVGMFVEGVGIQAMTTLTVVDYLTPTTVTMSLAATNSATETCTFWKYGNGDGSTTFNTPALGNYVKYGAGGPVVTGVIGNVTGQVGGTSTTTLTIDQMPKHNHPGSTVALGRANLTKNDTGQNAATAGPTALNIAEQGGGVLNTSGTPFNIIQQSAVVTYCIKT